MAETEWDRQTKVSLDQKILDEWVAGLRERDLVEVRASRTITSFQPIPALLVDGQRYQIRYFNLAKRQTWTVTRTHFA